MAESASSSRLQTSTDHGNGSSQVERGRRIRGALTLPDEGPQIASEAPSPAFASLIPPDVRAKLALQHAQLERHASGNVGIQARGHQFDDQRGLATHLGQLSDQTVEQALVDGSRQAHVGFSVGSLCIQKRIRDRLKTGVDDKDQSQGSARKSSR